MSLEQDGVLTAEMAAMGCREALAEILRISFRFFVFFHNQADNHKAKSSWGEVKVKKMYTVENYNAFSH